MDILVLRAVTRDHRFISFRLKATPIYQVKVGDEIFSWSDRAAGVTRVHSMWYDDCWGTLKVKVGARGLGEEIITTKDFNHLVWKVEELRKDEKHSKRSESTPKNYGLKNQFRDRTERWNVSRIGNQRPR